MISVILEVSRNELDSVNGNKGLMKIILFMQIKEIVIKGLML